MTTKYFCNRCGCEMTNRFKMPDDMQGGYFVLFQVFAYADWRLCERCLPSFMYDIDSFLKKQGYDIKDFQDFAFHVRDYFKKTDKAAAL